MPRLRELLTGFLITACVAVASRAHAGVLAYYDLNGITNAQISQLQYQTNNQLVFGATLTDWTKSGFNAVHAIQLSGSTPGGPGNYAIMIFGDNLITQQTAFAANDLGKTYYASYDIGPTVYATPSQATQAGDQLRINLLRNDNSVLVSSVVAPGAWQGVQTFSQQYFSYVGDGTGPLRLQMRSEQPGNGRFSGAVDNMAFWDTVPVPEPSAYAMTLAGLACGGLLMWGRWKRA
ncbi:MAG: PEP-CTERM sorting domain-containing protein [Planctomycetia bacterium]